MKKLLLGAAMSMAFVASSNASVIGLDPSAAGQTLEGFYTFDQIDFPANIQPVSYYIDTFGANGSGPDGRVSSGEFVFDFGTDITALEITGGDFDALIGISERQSGVVPSPEGFTLIADYVLTGTAIVLDAANNPTTDPLGTGNSDSLVADLTDGLFNLFLGDAVGNRVALAGSFLVPSDGTGVIPVGDGVGLTINAELIEAGENVLFDEFGNPFSDYLSDSPIGDVPTVSFTTTIQDATQVPGSHTSEQVGFSNPAAPDDTYYYTGVDTSSLENFGVSELLAFLNRNPEADFTGNPSDPADVRFGAVSDIINGQAAAEWNRIRKKIKQAAGCEGDTFTGECDYDVLARTTTIDGNARFNANPTEVSEPGTLLVGSLGLLLLGLRRIGK